jgi:NitT/TauT family transport system substrate-binding protein
MTDRWSPRCSDSQKGEKMNSVFRLPSLRSVRALLQAACVTLFGVCSAGAQGQPVTLKVGVLPIADVAPLYLGMSKGFYKEEGLDIVPQFSQGGAVIVPKVISGELDIGFSNIVSLLNAASRGLPIKIISQADQSNDESALVVSSTSNLQNVADLQGKTVGVVSLDNLATLDINWAAQKASGDWRKIKYVELSFLQMSAALRSNRVDAVAVSEPWKTIMRQAGMKNLESVNNSVALHSTVATYFATADFIKANEDVVVRFVRATHKSLIYAQEHQDEVRAVLPTYTKVPPEIIAEMRFPYFSTDLNVPSIETQARLAEEYGYVSKAPPLETFIWPGAKAK